MIKLKEIINKKKYYRAVTKFLGNEIVFKPEGYYEGIDDDGESIFAHGEYWESDVLQTAASKYIGGSILGSFSMQQNRGPYFVYEINESPDKDISHWGGADFEYLQEVRYQKDVDGKYIGKVILDKNTENIFREFYRLKSQTEDSWEDFDENEYTQKVIDMENDGKFQKLLNNIKVK